MGPPVAVLGFEWSRAKSESSNGCAPPHLCALASMSSLVEDIEQETHETRRTFSMFIFELYGINPNNTERERVS